MFNPRQHDHSRPYVLTLIFGAGQQLLGVLRGVESGPQAEEGPVVVIGPQHGEQFPAVPPGGHAQRPLVQRQVRPFRQTRLVLEVEHHAFSATARDVTAVTDKTKNKEK